MPIQWQNSLLLPTAKAQDLPGLASPSAGSLLFGTADFSGMGMPFVKNSLGETLVMQPHIGFRKLGMITAAGNSTTIQTIGIVSPTITSAVGTSTARNVSTGNVFNAARRIGYVSAATAGSSAGARVNVAQFFRGNAANLGGFFISTCFGISDAAYVSGSRLFAGLYSGTAVIGNVNPSTLTGIIGVGADAGETTLSIMHNDGSGTATKIDTGMPANTVNIDWYQLLLYCPPNHNKVYYQMIRVDNSGAVSFFPASARGEISTDLPDATQMLAWQLWRNNGATASAVGIDFGTLYTETFV
jgi:hypothetical protein